MACLPGISAHSHPKPHGPLLAPWDRLHFVRTCIAMSVHVCHLYTGTHSHLKMYHLPTGNNKTCNNLPWLWDCHKRLLFEHRMLPLMSRRGACWGAKEAWPKAAQVLIHTWKGHKGMQQGYRARVPEPDVPVSSSSRHPLARSWSLGVGSHHPRSAHGCRRVTVVAGVPGTAGTGPRDCHGNYCSGI